MSRLAVGPSARTITKTLYFVSAFTCWGPHGCISTLPVAEISSGVTLRRASLRLFGARCYDCNHALTVGGVMPVESPSVVVNIVG